VDIRLWIVQNPILGERDLLAIEITLEHHKGADKYEGIGRIVDETAAYLVHFLYVEGVFHS
jgi:hypothetical protein